MPDLFDFTLDGFSAMQAGIRLQKPVSIATATPIYDEAQIAGRSGTLVSWTGAFKNRKAQASCYALYNPTDDPLTDRTLMEVISSANGLLFSTLGYRRLMVSYDLEHYMKARITNGSEIQQRMERLNPFKIEFDCMPQRFLTIGEDPVEITTSGDIIANPTAFASAPLLVISGTIGGSGTITINETTIQILEIVSDMTIDCEIENCYNVSGNHNDKINATAFPKLISGNNAIVFDGDITSVTVTPRWWEI